MGPRSKPIERLMAGLLITFGVPWYVIDACRLQGNRSLIHSRLF
jgi:hypothetical protein